MMGFFEVPSLCLYCSALGAPGSILQVWPKPPPMELDDVEGYSGDGSDAGLAPWEIETPIKKREGEDKELQVTPAKKLKTVACIPCAKKKNGKFTVHCPGCLMYFAPKDIAANQRLDHQCKGIMDKIYYIAKSQKRMAWYTDIRSNDQKLYQAVTSYKSRCPEPEPGQRRARTSATQIMTYMEAVLVSTKVVKDVEGEFMYEREFYAFAETWAGGKLSEERAKAQWLKWKEQAADPSVQFPPTDNDGPENSPFRMWVRTRTKLNFQEAMEKQKQIQLKEKEKKNMQAHEIDEQHKRLLQDHEATAGAVASRLSSEEIARHLASAGQGGGPGIGAFQGRIVDIGNVEELAPPESAASNEDGAHDGDELEEEDEDTASGMQKKARKAAWFDWDKAVAAFARADQTSMENLTITVQKTYDSMKHCLAELASEKFVHLRPLLTSEAGLCESRAAFLALALSDAEDAELALKASCVFIHMSLGARAIDVSAAFML